MAQFDVHRNNAPSKRVVPYLLDVQNDLLARLSTRVVMPLVRPGELANRPIRHLHVEVEVAGERFYALGSELAAVPRSVLGKRVANLAARRADLVRAVDVILAGV